MYVAEGRIELRQLLYSGSDFGIRLYFILWLLANQTVTRFCGEREACCCQLLSAKWERIVDAMIGLGVIEVGKAGFSSLQFEVVYIYFMFFY